MSFNIKINPQSKKVVVSIQNISKVSKKGIRQAFYFIGKDLNKSSRDSIKEKPKSGRLYRIRRGGRIFNHRASAPGEAPANLTGALRRSINFTIQGSSFLQFGASAAYAGFLEDGTRKIEKRPFLIKSIKDNNRNIIEHFEKQIVKELKK